MFGSGSSPTSTKDNSEAAEEFRKASANLEQSQQQPQPISPIKTTNQVSSPAAIDGSPDPKSSGSMGKKGEDVSPNGDKRSRRASGVSKARELFSSAKQSFSPSPTRVTEKTIQTPIQKLGKTDPALSVPQGSLNNAAGESAPGPRSTFRVGVTEDKNKKCRRTMEDTHSYLYNFLSTPAPALDAISRPLSQTVSNTSANSNTPVVETDNGYFAIFDGHAGTFAAEWCGKKLHLLLEDLIRKNPNRAIPELLDETFTTVDHQLEKLPLKNSGTTAVIAVLRWEDRIPNPQSATGSTSIAPAAAAEIAKSSPGDQPTEAPSTAPTSGDPEAVESKLRETSSRQRVLYTANVGDARIVLCRNGKALRLSYDHKGSDDNEGKRIANAGGLILNNRVNGVLAVTRALGDAYMKDLVTGHPYTTETVIQPDSDEFLILACDGLWDVCSDQEAVDLVRSTHDPQAASRMLVEHALARFSTDNLSCMIVRFNTRAVQDTVEQRVEPIGVDGDPTSAKGGISETESIISAAKRDLAAGGGPQSGDEMAHVDGEQGLTRITAEMINEQEEDHREQEPGPELDPDGLERAREKAREGQMKDSQGGASDNPPSSTN